MRFDNCLRRVLDTAVPSLNKAARGFALQDCTDRSRPPFEACVSLDGGASRPPTRSAAPDVSSLVASPSLKERDHPTSLDSVDCLCTTLPGTRRIRMGHASQRGIAPTRDGQAVLRG